MAARAAQLADDGDVNAKACLEALGALVLWRAKACLDNIDDAGDAEPLDAVIVACADGAARALAFAERAGPGSLPPPPAGPILGPIAQP